MRARSVTLSFFIIFLCFLPFGFSRQKVNISASTLDLPSSTVRINNEYIWIWEEFVGAPGDLPRNDVSNWGPSLGSYHNRTEIKLKLKSLKQNFPDLVQISDIGFSHLGELIPLVILTDESKTGLKKEFFLVAHHHAREMITVENALYYIDQLIYDYINDDEETRKIFEERIIYVIPSLNIDSLDIMHIVPEQRKNLHPIDEDGDGTYDEQEVIFGYDTKDPDTFVGEDAIGGVDLNRNYAYQWDYFMGNSPENSSEIYRGEHPFSEVETLNLANFVRQHYFQSAVSLHSGIEMVLTPWGFDTSFSCPDEFMYSQLGARLASMTGLVFADLYSAAGEWGDWMYAARGIVAVMLETFSGDNWDYIWDGFNPHANGVIDNCRNIVFPGLKYMTTLDRPELVIIPLEDLSNLVTEFPTEESQLSFISVISLLSVISVIITINRRRKI